MEVSTIRFKIKRTNLLPMALLAISGNKKAYRAFKEYTNTKPSEMLMSHMDALVTCSKKERVIGEPITDLELSYLSRR